MTTHRTASPTSHALALGTLGLLELVEGHLGESCDDPDRFEAALFDLGLVAA